MTAATAAALGAHSALHQHSGASRAAKSWPHGLRYGAFCQSLIHTQHTPPPHKHTLERARIRANMRARKKRIKRQAETGRKREKGFGGPFELPFLLSGSKRCLRVGSWSPNFVLRKVVVPIRSPRTFEFLAARDAPSGERRRVLGRRIMSDTNGSIEAGLRCRLRTSLSCRIDQPFCNCCSHDLSPLESFKKKKT